MSVRTTISNYYRLSKPGIVYGNAIIAVAGYFFGAAGSPELIPFFGMLLGISAVMASACASNNVMDRNIDSRMARTQKRAVVTGQIRPRNALIYAALMLLLGLGLLAITTNALTVAVALLGHIAYVIVYGLAKRKTVHGTLVGTISGSTPPVIGYVAATGQVDMVAVILFLVLVAWQMPHFYAIAIFRRDDYASAKIPVLSVVKGLETTRRHIIGYVVLYLMFILILGIYGGASLLTTLVLLLTGLYWLYLCLIPTERSSYQAWSRKQFGWSLSLLLILSFTQSIDSLLHKYRATDSRSIDDCDQQYAQDYFQ
jgi:protoheme IX farnesyltransferase